MEFGFLGVNYKKAGLDIRDQTSFTDAMKLAFFQQAEKAGVDQCMVLSTCTRSEGHASHLPGYVFPGFSL